MQFLRNMTPLQASLIGIVIAGFLYFFVFGTTSSSKKIVVLKNKKKELLKKNKDADLLIEEAKSYKDSLNSLGNTINRVIKYIPKDMSSTKLMRKLTESAKESGVSIVGVSESQRRSNNKKKSELYEEVPVKIRLEGNFTQMMVFLSKLTELENIVTMNEFEISSNRALSEGVVAFAATFVGYRYKVTPQGAKSR